MTRSWTRALLLALVLAPTAGCEDTKCDPGQVLTGNELCIVPPADARAADTGSSPDGGSGAAPDGGSRP